MAAKPPMVAKQKLCGKCPSEKPRSPSRRSASGPLTPAPSSASHDTSSSHHSRSSRRRSSDTTALNRPRVGSRPPTTEVPPPKGTTAMLRSAQNRNTAATSSSLPGSSTASGASWTPKSRRRSRSSVDLPPARNRRSWSATATCSAPRIAAIPSRSEGDSADGLSRTCSRLGAATSVGSIPSACSSSDRIPGDSGLAAAGSPQPFHSMGGSFDWALASVMRYSITDGVNP